jgi:hypothetical protein
MTAWRQIASERDDFDNTIDFLSIVVDLGHSIEKISNDPVGLGAIEPREQQLRCQAIAKFRHAVLTAARFLQQPFFDEGLREPPFAEPFRNVAATDPPQVGLGVVIRWPTDMTIGAQEAAERPGGDAGRNAS